MVTAGTLIASIGLFLVTYVLSLLVAKNQDSKRRRQLIFMLIGPCLVVGAALHATIVLLGDHQQKVAQERIDALTRKADHLENQNSEMLTKANDVVEIASAVEAQVVQLGISQNEHFDGQSVFQEKQEKWQTDAEEKTQRTINQLDALKAALSRLSSELEIVRSEKDALIGDYQENHIPRLEAEVAARERELARAKRDVRQLKQDVHQLNQEKSDLEFQKMMAPTTPSLAPYVNYSNYVGGPSGEVNVTNYVGDPGEAVNANVTELDWLELSDTEFTAPTSEVKTATELTTTIQDNMVSAGNSIVTELNANSSGNVEVAGNMADVMRFRSSGGNMRSGVQSTGSKGYAQPGMSESYADNVISNFQPGGAFYDGSYTGSSTSNEGVNNYINGYMPFDYTGNVGNSAGAIIQSTGGVNLNVGVSGFSAGAAGSSVSISSSSSSNVTVNVGN